MKELFFNTIQEFNDYIGVETLHPLVSVVRVENASPIQEAGVCQNDASSFFNRVGGKC